jgi:hypothetical protein
MEKWEFKVLYGLPEDELNKWGEEGYKIDTIIPPPPPAGISVLTPEVRAMETTVILKRRKL